jgi:hypothetical protein
VYQVTRRPDLRPAGAANVAVLSYERLGSPSLKSGHPDRAILRGPSPLSQVLHRPSAVQLGDIDNATLPEERPLGAVGVSQPQRDLGLGMAGRAVHVAHAGIRELLCQIAGDVAGPVAVEQVWTTHAGVSVGLFLFSRVALARCPADFCLIFASLGRH